MLTAVLIVAATRGSGVLVALLSRPLIVAVGRRSYGLYLYHWPVFVLGRELPLPPSTINLLGVLVTVAVAEASYRWIETPVRRGGLAALMSRLRLPRPAAGVAFGAATSALLTTVVALSGPSNAAGDDPATAVVANSAGAAADLSGGGQAGAPGSSTCAATSGVAGPGVPAGQAARPGYLPGRRRGRGCLPDSRRRRASRRRPVPAAERPAQAAVRPAQAVQRGRRAARWCRASSPGRLWAATGRAERRARRSRCLRRRTLAARGRGGARARRR